MDYFTALKIRARAVEMIEGGSMRELTLDDCAVFSS